MVDGVSTNSPNSPNSLFSDSYRASAGVPNSTNWASASLLTGISNIPISKNYAVGATLGCGLLISKPNRSSMFVTKGGAVCADVCSVFKIA